MAALADRQHGVVARRQLLSAGIGGTAVRERVRAGGLIPLHRGVYAVGHRRLRREGWWLAAVLAAGDRAALSHRDAAALHGLMRSETRRTKVEVTTPGRGRPTSALLIRQRRALGPADVTVTDAIPVTTVARTLVDLAETVSAERLASALAEAERTHALDARAIETSLDRLRGRTGPGHAALVAALADYAARSAQLTRSELELRFLALLRDAGLPSPATNVRIEGAEVDAAWPDRHLAVELDGWTFHRGRAAFERDRIKGNDLTVAGWTLLRFTHDQVVRRRREVAGALRRALGPQSSTRTVSSCE